MRRRWKAEAVPFGRLVIEKKWVSASASLKQSNGPKAYMRPIECHLITQPIDAQASSSPRVRWGRTNCIQKSYPSPDPNHNPIPIPTNYANLYAYLYPCERESVCGPI